MISQHQELYVQALIKGQVLPLKKATPPLCSVPAKLPTTQNMLRGTWVKVNFQPDLITATAAASVRPATELKKYIRKV